MQENLFLKYAKKNNIEKQVIESILFKVIVDFFKEKKDIDIKKYIISIKMQEKIIIVKTYKASVNYEFSLYKTEIIDIFFQKLEKIGFKKDFIIYFK